MINYWYQLMSWFITKHGTSEITKRYPLTWFQQDWLSLNMKAFSSGPPPYKSTKSITCNYKSNNRVPVDTIVLNERIKWIYMQVNINQHLKLWNRKLNTEWNIFMKKLSAQQLFNMVNIYPNYHHNNTTIYNGVMYC